MSSAAPVWWARSAATSRTWGYGASRFSMQVVAVVPDHDEPEVADGCVDRGAGADDDAGGARAAPAATGGTSPGARGRR